MPSDYSRSNSSILTQLGYPSDTSGLIVQCDDFGMAHSINSATLSAVATGLIDAVGIMVPVPWFSEAVSHAKATHCDWGLHGVLTSEWRNYRWRPLSSRSHGPLVDSLGYFHATASAAASHLTTEAVHAELVSQHEHASAHGLKIAYADSHMHVCYTRPDLMRVFTHTFHSLRIPTVVNRDVARWHSVPSDALGTLTILPDSVIRIAAHNNVAPLHWRAYYAKCLRALPPGIHALLLHVGYDHSELKGITGIGPYDAAWRQRDLDFVLDGSLATIMAAAGVVRLTWSRIASAMTVLASRRRDNAKE
jgi:predicted glycoside hydrolase/deacetylase ChbG (UPF0249 family)